jgi:hypothetical protein
VTPEWSVDTKHYKVEAPKGRSNLVHDIAKQSAKRQEHLPAHMKQRLILDIRGKQVSDEVLNTLVQRISTKSGIPVDHIEILK